MNRQERRARAGKDGIHRAPDGRRMAILRPDDPGKALAIAEQALKRQDRELLADLPNRAGCKYTFVGWLSSAAPQHIVDERGRRIGDLQPGDSFVTYENDAPPIGEAMELPMKTLRSS